MLEITLTTISIIWLFGIYPAYYTVGLLATIPRRRAAIALFWPPVLLVYAGIMLWVAVRPKPKPMPRTLREFLGRRGWKKYVANGGNPENAEARPGSRGYAYICGAFTWRDTPEGRVYWIALHNRWRRLCEMYEKSEAGDR